MLLVLVEAVDLVEEEDRPLPVRTEALARVREDLSYLRNRCRHRRQLLERRAGHVRDDPSKRRLPGSRWSVEDRGAHAVLLDRRPERRSLSEHLLLPDELIERLRPHPQRERRDLWQALFRGV